MMDRIKKNLGTTVFLLNCIGLALGILFHDPFSWFLKDYQNSQSFFPEIEKVQEIEFRKLENSENSKVEREQKFYKKSLPKKNSSIGMGWFIEIEGKSVLLSAKKMEELLTGLSNSRKFTNLGKNAESYGFKDGYYEVKINDTSLKISSSSDRSGGSYVQDRDGQIYLVSENILNLFGQYDPFYLVDRALFTNNPKPDSITSLSYIHKGNRIFSLEKKEDNWSLQERPQEKINPNTVNSLIERMLPIEARKFSLGIEPGWKRIPTQTIQWTIAVDGIVETLNWDCNFQDQEENAVCQVSGREGYFTIDSYLLETITDRKGKDFL